MRYVAQIANLPPETRYFLVRPDNDEAARTSEQWAPRHPRRLMKVKDYRNQTVVLFSVDGS